jgi:TPR repeat protein
MTTDIHLDEYIHLVEKSFKINKLEREHGKTDLSRVIEDIYYRKQVLFQGNFLDVKRMVSEIASWIPKESLAQLEQGYKQEDPQLTLLYADCYMYGLKGEKRDEERATELYRKAAKLNLPEAMVALARLDFQTIQLGTHRCQAASGNFDVGDLCVKRMWKYLEKSAELGWKSLLLFQLALYPLQTKAWEISTPVLEMLEEMAVDFAVL